MVRTLISFLMLTSQWRVLIIYNITHSYCNSGAERYLPGELLLKSPCKSEKSQKVNYTSSSSVHHWKLVMFYWRGPLTHVKSSAWAAFPEHWCQVTSQSPENNSQVVCHAPIGCPLPPYTRMHQRNLWAYQSRVNYTVKALAYSHF